MKFKFFNSKTIDWILYLVPVLLMAAGLAVIYSLTYFNDKISLFYGQLTYTLIALIIMVVLTFWDYRNLRGLAIYLYLLGVILLILILYFGKSAFGATRWLDLGFFQLQPSELMKLFIVIVLARYFADIYGEIKPQHIFIALILTIISAYLILMQPDLGTVSVLSVGALSVLFFAKLTKKQIISLILLIIMALPLIWFNLKPYQKERVYTFLNPSSDVYGSGYNVLQSTITIGSGGLFGKGLGHGPQSQLNFLPVAHTDFIFAGVAEASGLIGSMVLIILFLILIFRIINIARISKDNFGMLLAVGFGAVIFFQMAVNIGMNLGLTPVTGVPLPFVSHGGTSLIMNAAIIGILQSIYLRHKKITF